MSIWGRAQQLPPDHLQKVQAIYSDYFPIEVRHYLASWLENRIWATEADEQQDTFVKDLVQEIYRNCEMMTSPDSFVPRVKLTDAAKNFSIQFERTPRDLYSYMKQCLGAELAIIESAINVPYVPQPQEVERKYSELLTGLHNVRQSVTQAHEEIRTLQASIESFSLIYHQCITDNYIATTQGPNMSNEYLEMESRRRIRIESLKSQLNTMVIQYKQALVVLIERLTKNIDTLRDLQVLVLENELLKWKREQQLNGNGVPMTTCLNKIQEWCEALAELVWATRQQLANLARIQAQTRPELQQPQLTDKLHELNKQVTCLLSTLVTSTFVIEKQPPQVMKTNTRFTATVRLLVGAQLNVHMTPPRVTVSIISEQQAQQLMRSEPNEGQTRRNNECGEILNNIGFMEFHSTKKELSVSFRNMQLRKIKRAEKKGTESVMDEKLTLLFESKFKVGSGELDFHVWTLSLPVVVIVHGNQEPHGWATVTWDNAFSQLKRQPFVVPDKVLWGQLADTLRTKWKAATDGQLSEDNLRFLAEKIFRSPVPQNLDELNAMPVTWTQFCKDALPDRNFTFWEWFYMVVKITKDNLKPLWCDGLIIGFIQKKQAEETLARCQPGTFLLRFSDSELGGITIAWVGENDVFSLQPFTSRDLLLRGLPDRISDLAHLQYLYPNEPKDRVFSKYYTKPENEMQKNGYVKPVLVTTLPAPFMVYGQSPDPQRNTPSVQSSYPPSVDTTGELMYTDLLDNLAFDMSFDMYAPSNVNME